MQKYKVGLVIGRFQPFHNGHRYLLFRALRVAEKIVIGIGSSNIVNDQNPIRYQKRLGIIQTFLEKENLTDKVIQIVPIRDYPSDKTWLRQTLQLTGQVDVVIGNNEWVNGIFAKAGYPVKTIPYLNRKKLEGTTIRQRIKTGKKWKDRVPVYLQEQLTEMLEREVSDSSNV